MESGCCIDLCHPFTTLGTHVTWASAPTLRVVFASSKETQKRPPTKGWYQPGLTVLLRIFCASAALSVVAIESL